MGADRFTTLADELDRQRAELERAQKALSQLTSCATSRDRLVALTVNARGLPVDISIDPIALRRYRADQLSVLLVELAAQADAALAARRHALLEAAATAEPGLAGTLRELGPDDG